MENKSVRHWLKGYEVREIMGKEFVKRFKRFCSINVRDFGRNWMIL